MNDNLRDAITYCALAVACFVFSFFQYFSAAVTSYMVLSFNIPPPIDPMVLVSMIIPSLIPLAGAIITLALLMHPLWHNKLPSRLLFFIMGIVGFIAGLVVGGVLIFLAYSKIYWREKPPFPED